MSDTSYVAKTEFILEYQGKLSLKQMQHKHNTLQRKLGYIYNFCNTIKKSNLGKHVEHKEGGGQSTLQGAPEKQK